MSLRKDSLVITIQGIVQGVGFRPFIYSLAHEMQVSGYVSNTSDGVIIRAEGNDLVSFVERIKQEAPRCHVLNGSTYPLQRPAALRISRYRKVLMQETLPYYLRTYPYAMTAKGNFFPKATEGMVIPLSTARTAAQDTLLPVQSPMTGRILPCMSLICAENAPPNIMTLVTEGSMHSRMPVQRAVHR